MNERTLRDSSSPDGRPGSAVTGPGRSAFRSCALPGGLVAPWQVNSITVPVTFTQGRINGAVFIGVVLLDQALICSAVERNRHNVARVGPLCGSASGSTNCLIHDLVTSGCAPELRDDLRDELRRADPPRPGDQIGRDEGRRGLITQLRFTFICGSWRQPYEALEGCLDVQKATPSNVQVRLQLRYGFRNSMALRAQCSDCRAECFDCHALIISYRVAHNAYPKDMTGLPTCHVPDMSHHSPLRGLPVATLGCVRSAVHRHRDAAGLWAARANDQGDASRCSSPARA